MKPLRPLLCVALLFATPVVADAPEVVAVSADRQGDIWRIDVTLRHPDTGWDHYADGWEILTPDGRRLGFRELFHPHVNEQPFTRSLDGVVIPKGVTQVMVRARCNVDGWATETVTVNLPD
ncbi:hypothetical protein ACVDG3_11885 [Meridianimarinicoccus sp. RP-17]|uniref:hypothetical protein n=1 Tax=Meridianimarinicoccus zhengii TaxID=2056810 RepID=UPI000DAD4B45|nr:hypothetical protein [Phycocomes zhengii]